MNKAMACIFPIRPDRKIIMWELTRKCNVFCKHCISDAKAASTENELSTEIIMSIMDELVSLGFNELYLTGGEPSLRPDYIDILEYAKKRFQYLAAATNGYKLSEEYFEKSSSLGLNHLNISLDHHRPDMHDGLRGLKGSFREAIISIKRLLEADVPVHISTAITNHNCRDLESIVNFVKSMGIKAIVFNWIIPLGRAEFNIDYLPEKSEYPSIITEIKRLYRIYELEKKFPRILYRRYITNGQTPLEMCPGGRTSFFITSSGKVSPCSFLARFPQGQFVFGDLSIQNFSDIVYSKSFQTALETLRSRGRNIPECVKCDVLECGYGCPAFSYVWGGNLNHIDPICGRGKLNDISSK
ncbi:radical SAM/SPASM domain-containing protein [Thermodesulfobacteriota bacterium]